MLLDKLWVVLITVYMRNSINKINHIQSSVIELTDGLYTLLNNMILLEKCFTFSTCFKYKRRVKRNKHFRIIRSFTNIVFKSTQNSIFTAWRLIIILKDNTTWRFTDNSTFFACSLILL